MLRLLCTVFLINLIIPTVSCQTMGPADVRFLYVEKCRDYNANFNISITGRRVSKTMVVMDMDIDLPYPLDEKIVVKVDVSVQGNGGWKPNFYSMTFKDPCNALRNYIPEFFEKFCKDSGCPKSCPIRKGSLRVKSWPVDTKEYKMPEILPYAKFRATAKYLRDNKQFACTNSYFNVVPKKKVVFKSSS